MLSKYTYYLQYINYKLTRGEAAEARISSKLFWTA